MEGVGAVVEEVAGSQVWGPGLVKWGMLGLWDGEGSEFKCQGRCERAVVVFDVTEEKAIRVEGVVCEEETASGSGEEVFGAFEGGGSGVAAFGGTVADEEAGDVAFDEALVEGRRGDGRGGC